MSAEVELAEASQAIDEARTVLRKLQLHDTHDRIADQARRACEDAQEHLEDVIYALAEGLLPELTP